MPEPKLSAAQPPTLAESYRKGNIRWTIAPKKMRGQMKALIEEAVAASEVTASGLTAAEALEELK